MTHVAEPIVVAIPLRPHEAALIRRAVDELVEREGESWTAVNVLQVMERPLRLEELGALGEVEEDRRVEHVGLRQLARLRG
jgi:hypothetical protein